MTAFVPVLRPPHAEALRALRGRVGDRGPLPVTHHMLRTLYRAGLIERIGPRYVPSALGVAAFRAHRAMLAHKYGLDPA